MAFKQFELSKHLGNVLDTILDRRTLFDTVVIINDTYNDTFAIWDADIVAAQDYYPFGMLLPNRVYSADSTGTGKYRFGFNGMEREDEWNGPGNAYDFGARIYDSRLGRWLARDPMEKAFPFESPYNYCSGIVIIYKDEGGRKKTLTISYVDSKTGEIHNTVVVETSDVMVIHEPARSLGDDSKYLIHDINATQIIYWDSEKNEVASVGKVSEEPRELRKRATFGWFADWQIDDGPLDDVVGYMFTRSGGQGEETRTSSKFIIMNKYVLMPALGATKSSAGVSKAKGLLSVLKYLHGSIGMADKFQKNGLTAEELLDKTVPVYLCQTTGCMVSPTMERVHKQDDKTYVVIGEVEFDLKTGKHVITKEYGDGEDDDADKNSGTDKTISE